MAISNNASVRGRLFPLGHQIPHVPRVGASPHRFGERVGNGATAIQIPSCRSRFSLAGHFVVAALTLGLFMTCICPAVP